MTVGELLDQIAFMLEKGAISRETQVLADGCDCTGEALAAVVVQEREWGDGRLGDPITKLLVSRENSDGGRPPQGVRVADLKDPPDPPARTFTITEAKGS